MDPHLSAPPPPGDDRGDDVPLACQRVRLLLSLHVDDEATPTQEQEIDAHLPDCADCRAAREVDRMVRAHVTAALAAIAPGELAAPVVRRAIADVRAARSDNRFLLVAAAAAVLIAVAAGALRGPGAADGALRLDDQVSAARASTRRVLSVPAPEMPARRR